MKTMLQQTVRALTLTAAFLTLGVGSALAQAGAQAWHNIGRDAKPAEIKAWDIDVRPDFKGLPRGAGSVSLGEQVWESSCASCHGIFGESNEVFTPIVGGTTKQDILTGRVRNLLADSNFPQRTTMMKAPHVSTLWDYINRAMPWQAPKSLSVDEVYATVAYILYLSDVVPNDFVLSHENIAQVQQRMPNRNGMVFFEPMWRVDGRADVRNTACMKNCPTKAEVRSALPDFARNAHGNIKEQNRVIGPVRGANTLRPAPTAPLTQRISIAPVVVGMAASGAAASGAGGGAVALLNANACMACHGINNSIVGPSFADIAARNRGREGVEAHLVGKIMNGASGVYGAIPMPPQPHVSQADAQAIAAWIAAGATAR